MTQTDYGDNVVITGSRDIDQLKIKANATQTKPLQSWKDSGPDTNLPLAQVTGDGRIQVGDDVGLSSPDALIEAHRSETSTTKPKRGFHSLGRVSDTLGSIIQWMVAELELRGSGAIGAVHSALRVKASNFNTGTPTTGAELRAGDFEVNNDASASAAALPNATGLQVSVTNAAGKTIINPIGLKVKMNNAGAMTNPFAIYTEGPGGSHLENFLELKLPTTPPSVIPATDLLQVYPKSNGKLYYRNWTHNLEITTGMDLLMTYDVSSLTDSITLTNIPQNYQHLKLYFRGRCDIAATLGGLLLRPNGDATPANYFNTWISCISSGSVFVYSYDQQPAIIGLIIAYGLPGAQAPSNSFATSEISLHNYSEIGKMRQINYQLVNYATGNVNVAVSSGGGVWTNTADAITSLIIRTSGGYFVPGTSVRLYGVA